MKLDLLRILHLLNLPLLCLSCSPMYWRNPNINENNLKWIVEIFTLPLNAANSTEAVFRCIGVLIHPRAVLTTRKCIPEDDFSRNVTVRVYSWSTRNSKQIVQELFVSRSFYEKFYDAEIFRANLNLFTTLIVEDAFDIGPMIDITDSYKINTTIDSTCIYLDIQAQQPYALTREQFWTYHSSEQECCDVFGDWSIPIENKTLQYDCQKHPSSFCTNSYFNQCQVQGRQGSPVFCPSTHDSNTYIIAGLLIDNAWCHYHFAKIEDIRKYINKALTNVTSSR